MSSVLLIPTPFFTGLATGAGLIIAIGAQNAFVLSQGVRRQFHWQIAILCSFIDAVLILLGVTGMGVLLTQSPGMMWLITWCGAAFLFWYGLSAFRAVFQGDSMQLEQRGFSNLKMALTATLALSLLNPHVYLDTVVLLGSIGGRFEEGGRYWFAAGATLFSFIWFFSLSLGASLLAPLFRKPVSWRILDGLVCLMMWTLAVLLITGRLQ